MSDFRKTVSRRDFAKNEDGRGPSIPYEGSNNPRAGQWDGRRLSRSRVADYKPFVVTDGEGLRCSIYVSGCSFGCDECFNASIWDYQAGFDYTDALEDRIIRDVSLPHVDGLTLLGGEPLLNTPMLIKLCKRFRSEFGDSKTIWSWTGYTWEELMRPGETEDKMELLSYVDILVDGRFVKTLKDTGLQFRGSSNQRIIDVRKSMGKTHPVIWDKLHDNKGAVYEVSIKERNSMEQK